ncbi:MAG: MFS transporter, partial [Actinomyces sp. oral taxon 181]|nr:MFS transporter [Actinomyces sp. oral taxon 181]
MQTPQRTHISDTTLGWISFSTLFVVGTDTFLVAPLLPELRQQFGVGVEASGWMVSAYALGYALCALIAGPMSDLIDRRQMLLAGMAAFSVLTACCGFAWGFWPMVVLRF